MQGEKNMAVSGVGGEKENKRGIKKKELHQCEDKELKKEKESHKENLQLHVL